MRRARLCAYRATVTEVPLICSYILGIHRRERKAGRAIGQGEDPGSSRSISVLGHRYGIYRQTSGIAGYIYYISARCRYGDGAGSSAGSPVIVTAVFTTRTCIQYFSSPDTESCPICVQVYHWSRTDRYIDRIGIETTVGICYRNKIGAGKVYITGTGRTVIIPQVSGTRMLYSRVNREYS
ncbi:hypothetical protein D3C72_1737890 [compost metagenome]